MENFLTIHSYLIRKLMARLQIKLILAELKRQRGLIVQFRFVQIFLISENESPCLLIQLDSESPGAEEILD